jgi:small multidrug resistance pump
VSSYLLLLIAIATEVVATSALKATHGFTRPLPSAIVVLGYGASFYLMTIVLKRLDLGVVYATWSALGTAAVAFIGVTLYGDSLSLGRIAGLVLVIAGVAVLNLSGGNAH